MLLHILGSGTCELRRERSSPAYLVEAGETVLLMDLGQGALRRLLQAGRDPAGLAGVILSHHHLDHLADLMPLLFALNYDPHLASRAQITLLGHPGLERVLEGLGRVFGSWIQPGPQRWRVRWLEPGRQTELGDIRITTARASHMETSLAFRLERGEASLVYLGDSAYAPELVELARGAGLLLAHCAAPDHAPKPGHLTPGEAGELAAAAGAGMLVLSHLYREVEPQAAVASAGRSFSGPILAARDHLELAWRGDGFAPLG